MADPLSTLFDDLDPGMISRRHLLQMLGLAAVAAPMAAFGQGSCGGTRAMTPQCDTIPFKPPFEPTGWKTVLLDHFSVQAADYQKEAAYFNALMGWKVRSVDETKAVLDIGDWGGVVIRAMTAAPPTPPGDSAGRGGAGGRAGGGRAPRAIWDGFCWGIDNWDTNKVEAELKKRGLNPVADHDGKDFQSFHVKDPDGFDVQISNGNKKNRRTTPATGKLSTPAPFEATGWKTAYLDHISFAVTSYKESAAFYHALLGWNTQVHFVDAAGKEFSHSDIGYVGDEGSQNETQINPEIGDIIIRGGNANAPGGLTAGRGGGGRGRAGGDTTGGRGGAPPTPAPLVRRATINHVSFGLADFDPDKVKAELDKRSLASSVDTGNTGDIHDTAYKSYHTTTPNGFTLQISNKVAPFRTK